VSRTYVADFIMSDKVNMSLDEIIRASKARRANEAGGGRNTVAKKQGARLSAGRGRAAGRPGGMRTNFTKKIVKKAVQNQRNVAARRNVKANSGMVPRSQLNSLVNKAVKQAMKQSNANIGVVGRLGGGAIPRNIITASRLAQLSQRSRVIQRNRAIPQNRQRGRGFGANQPIQYVQEVVSPQPVRIIRQPVQAPVVQVVERIVPARQQVRKIGGRGGFARQQQIARVGGGGRIVRQTPVIMRQPAQRVVQRPVQRVIQQQRVVQRPVQEQRIIQQRVIRQPQQVIYERPAPQRVQVVRRQAPVQRVQVIRQAAPAPRRNRQNVQYVEYAAGPSPAVRNKNNRMRDALGLSNSRQVVRETQRFEPSSSFLANRTVSNVKGRGFSGRRNAY
ncbi:hypothetical protein PENTCL1PPCAC_27375, partial [Pristionchus entomophagus]